MTLDEAIDLFINARRADGAAANTLRNYRSHLGHLRRVIGSRHLSQIGPRDVDLLFSDLNGRLSGVSINGIHATLNLFFRWCRARGYVPAKNDPMADRRMRKVARRERRRVPLGEFAALLDAAQHPRDRMVLSLGLYLMLRQSEIADLRVGDVDLESGEITVRIFKTHDVDAMPIVTELDNELRAWLTYYTQQVGPLDPSWHLVPARRLDTVSHDENGRLVNRPEDYVLVPDQKMTRVHDIAKRALQGIGWELRDEGGKAMHEGMHTLRRSGARALFDELVGQGYDGALRTVQAFLHHKNSTMTEHYLGLEIDRSQRNRKFSGSLLLPSARADNVVVLRSGNG